MASLHIARQGETVDLACHAFYGRTASVTERVLDANPGLAALGPFLPMGTRIIMPEVETRPSAPTLIELYD